MKRCIMSGLVLVFLAVGTGGFAGAADYESEAINYDRDRIAAEYIAANPEAILEISFTEAEMKEAEALRDARLSELDKMSLMEEQARLQVQLNGVPVNAPPYISVNYDQVMVPLRWSANLLGAASVDWDAATRTVTITTPQDFYNMEKYGSYAAALNPPVEFNDKIWPLTDKVKEIEVPDLTSNRPWVLNLQQFKPENAETQPHDNITITITSPDGIYTHSSVANSIENHQGHYYLPMDWLEYLFSVRVSYNEAANILDIQTPDPEQIKSELARIEKALIPDNADDAVKLWGRGMQTRNGALQYAALSPQLRQEADKSPYVQQSYWVTGCSSPQVGPVTIASRNALSDNKIEYTISFPEIFASQTHATATEKMVVEKLSDNGQDGWFITQILEASGYGIINDASGY
jgi:hypothetical protein